MNFCTSKFNGRYLWIPVPLNLKAGTYEFLYPTIPFGIRATARPYNQMIIQTMNKRQTMNEQIGKTFR